MLKSLVKKLREWIITRTHIVENNNSVRISAKIYYRHLIHNVPDITNSHGLSLTLTCKFASS